MSTFDATEKRALSTLPVRAVQVRVVAGPDRGREAPVDRDVLSVGSAEGNDLVLHDPATSRFHLEVRRAADGIVLRDHGSTNGTRVGSVTFRGAEVTVAPGTIIELGDSKIAVEDAERFVLIGAGPERFGALRGRSPALVRCMSTLAKVAATNVPVLIRGESGTGKELAARAIHAASARASQPFVTLDCGAIAPSLFASELFGHEKGAFTGADRRHAGAFERAALGTLFLDEIGELSLELQASLLGVLERRVLRRVGGTDDVPVEPRIVAATHRDLRAAVNAGSFRLDLYYRLATVSVTMPSLRERAEDLPLLVRQFLEEEGRGAELDALFPPDTMSLLASHDWPGNVRELRNVVLGAVALGETPDLRDQPSGVATADPIEAVLNLDYGAAKRAVLDQFERRWIARLLERTDGNVRAASREGRVERKHLAELIRRHRLR